MLVEMAIGDAYGAAFEFMCDDFIARENDLSGYKRNPETGLGEGRYTDDTQMAVAMAEHLLSGDAFNAPVLADRFVTTFKRDPRRGYSKRVLAALEGAVTGQDFLAAIEPASNRGGAAMRVSPLGLVPNLHQVCDWAALQASPTHDTTEGRMSACAIAVMVHYLAHRLGPRGELGRFVETQVPGRPWSLPWTGRVDMSGLACAHAAISLVERTASLSQLLSDAVALGGDTDTVAAMAMFAGSLCDDVMADLPAILIDGLENGPFGLEYLRSLDARLVALVAKNSTLPQSMVALP